MVTVLPMGPGEFHQDAFIIALDVFLADEAHLHVHLGELGLPVGAQILVPEAAADLDVALEARDLEQLLVELRASGAARRTSPGCTRLGTR